ncbi:MAG: helix-turn-helix domain-containing protein [Fusobacteriaceae bacterium]|jgi:DNA-binding XRE family transcriptional regulator|nr:helix-turn-helix domain-containing protein [Fusobacteriaceae bacterium]
MFLSPGEKLLQLRKKYKITQVELSEGVISRTSLGMIETGKRSMSAELARLLCENMSKILKERGIRDRINVDEVLKSKDAQALAYLAEATNAGSADIASREWDLDEGLSIVAEEKRADWAAKIYRLFLEAGDPVSARKYLICCLHFYRSAEKPQGLADILADLFAIDEGLGEYREIVRIYENFEETLVEEDHKSPKLLPLRIAYAGALARCKRKDEAEELLKFLMKKARTDQDFFLCRKSLANLYNTLNKYDEAIAEYTSLAKGKSQEVKAELYSYVLEIGYDIGEEDVIKKYYNRTRDIFEEITFSDQATACRVASVLGKCTMYLNNMEKAKEYMLKAFQAGKETSASDESQTELVRLLFEIFEVRDFDSVKKMEAEYRELLKRRPDHRPAIAILNFYKKWMPIELEKKFREYK